LLRRLGSDVAITATNNAATAQTVSLKLPEGVQPASLRDALSGFASGGAFTTQGSTLTLTLPPLFGVVLLGQITTPAAKP